MITWINEIHSIRDLIYFRYINLVCEKRSKVRIDNDNVEGRRDCIKVLFQELKKGIKIWSDIILDDDKELFDTNKQCIYCGSYLNVSPGHLIPRSMKILRKCNQCEIIKGPNNLVSICRDCNRIRRLDGLYEFYKSRYSNTDNYYELIPAVVEIKYLETLYCCHKCAGTLDTYIKSNGKGFDLVVLDSILHIL